MLTDVKLYSTKINTSRKQVELSYNRVTLTKTLKRWWYLLRKWSENKGKQFENMGVLEYKKYTVTFDEIPRMVWVSSSATLTQNNKYIKRGQNFVPDLYSINLQQAARGNWLRRYFKHPYTSVKVGKNIGGICFTCTVTVEDSCVLINSLLPNTVAGKGTVQTVKSHVGAHLLASFLIQCLHLILIPEHHFSSRASLARCSCGWHLSSLKVGRGMQTCTIIQNSEQMLKRYLILAGLLNLLDFHLCWLSTCVIQLNPTEHFVKLSHFLSILGLSTFCCE